MRPSYHTTSPCPGPPTCLRRLTDRHGEPVRKPRAMLRRSAEILEVLVGADVARSARHVDLLFMVEAHFWLGQDPAALDDLPVDLDHLRPSPLDPAALIERFRVCPEHGRQHARACVRISHYIDTFAATRIPDDKLFRAVGTIVDRSTWGLLASSLILRAWATNVISFQDADESISGLRVMTKQADCTTGKLLRLRLARACRTDDRCTMRELARQLVRLSGDGTLRHAADVAKLLNGPTAAEPSDFRPQPIDSMEADVQGE